MKTAVILTARKERDSAVPYPLLPFSEDVCLFDRTLQILREAGYQHIVAVIGYKAEMFRRYESQDVILITNQDYEFTSSMGSLAQVESVVDEDFLLIEGDTFYEKKVIQQLTNLTETQYQKLCEKYGEVLTNKAIELFEDWLQRGNKTAKEYIGKNHYAHFKSDHWTIKEAERIVGNHQPNWSV